MVSLTYQFKGVNTSFAHLPIQKSAILVITIEFRCLLPTRQFVSLTYQFRGVILIKLNSGEMFRSPTNSKECNTVFCSFAVSGEFRLPTNYRHSFKLARDACSRKNDLSQTSSTIKLSFPRRTRKKFKFLACLFTIILFEINLIVLLLCLVQFLLQ